VVEEEEAAMVCELLWEEDEVVVISLQLLSVLSAEKSYSNFVCLQEEMLYIQVYLE
jgi:hypothetical protein